MFIHGSSPKLHRVLDHLNDSRLDFKLVCRYRWSHNAGTWSIKIWMSKIQHGSMRWTLLFSFVVPSNPFHRFFNPLMLSFTTKCSFNLKIKSLVLEVNSTSHALDDTPHRKELCYINHHGRRTSQYKILIGRNLPLVTYFFVLVSTPSQYNFL